MLTLVGFGNRGRLNALSLPIDALCAVPDRNGVAIAAAFDLVDIKVLRQLAHWLAAELPFHGPNTGVAEIPEYRAVAVVGLLAKLIQPEINERRNASLLGADGGMGT